MNQDQALAMLLQPALIRLIDQLRQQFSKSSWKWSYETLELWPESVSVQTQQQYVDLLAALENAPDEAVDALQDQLMAMPQPIPLYRLDIELPTTAVAINLWELCYQICLVNYVPDLSNMTVQAPKLEIYTLDPALVDSDEDVYWPALDQKAAATVKSLIETLQNIN